LLSAINRYVQLFVKKNYSYLEKGITIGYTKLILYFRLFEHPKEIMA